MGRKRKRPSQGVAQRPQQQASSSPFNPTITVTTNTAQLQYPSPIPPPEILEQYERIIPGASQRFLALVEQQTEHRQGLERRHLWHGIVSRYVAQASALLVGLTGIVAAGVVGYHGEQWAAGAIAALDIGGLVAVYL